eukprot:7387928-Prymnesium_polylepis.1
MRRAGTKLKVGCASRCASACVHHTHPSISSSARVCCIAAQGRAQGGHTTPVRFVGGAHVHVHVVLAIPLLAKFTNTIDAITCPA